MILELHTGIDDILMRYNVVQCHWSVFLNPSGDQGQKFLNRQAHTMEEYHYPVADHLLLFPFL